jgi:hypothetical protein
MFALATILALLIATAGWHYLFYSRAAQRLSGVEEQRLNRLRVVLRRAGGVVLLVLGPTFFAGFRTLLPETSFDPATFVGLWLAVLGLMGLMVVLALADVRLTWKLRRHQLARPAGGGDA